MGDYVVVTNWYEVFDESNLVVAKLSNGATTAQNVNGSVTPQEFYYEVPSGKNFICKQITMYMEGSTAFSSDLFANLAKLTNGWQLAINGVPSITVKDNVELINIMFDSGGVPLLGKETRTLLGKFSVSEITNHHTGLTIRGNNRISTIVNDDLSTLVRLEVIVQGYLVDDDYKGF